MQELIDDARRASNEMASAAKEMEARRRSYERRVATAVLVGFFALIGLAAGLSDGRWTLLAVTMPLLVLAIFFARQARRRFSDAVVDLGSSLATVERRMAAAQDAAESQQAED